MKSVFLSKNHMKNT